MEKMVTNWEETIAFLTKQECIDPIGTICQICVHYGLTSFRLRLLHVLQSAISSERLGYESEDIADLVDFFLELTKLFEAANIVNDLINVKNFAYTYMHD